MDLNLSQTIKLVIVWCEYGAHLTNSICHLILPTQIIQYYSHVKIGTKIHIKMDLRNLNLHALMQIIIYRCISIINIFQLLIIMFDLTVKIKILLMHLHNEFYAMIFNKIISMFLIGISHKSYITFNKYEYVLILFKNEIHLKLQKKPINIHSSKSILTLFKTSLHSPHIQITVTNSPCR